MMNQTELERRLLNALLDRYERSKSFSEEAPGRRRVLLRLYQDGKSDFSLYNIEDNDARCGVNQAAAHLAAMHWIGLEWMRGEEGHILRRVALLPHAIPEIYRAVGRVPLQNQLELLEGELDEALNTVDSDWAKAYLLHLLDFIRHNRRSPAELPSDPQQRKEWLSVLCAAASPRQEPLLERTFSIRYLGDSKAFENSYRGMLLSALRRFLAIDTSEMSNDELLRQVGLEKYPELFSLCGNISLLFPGQPALSIRSFADGIQLSARDAAALQLRFSESVHTLLFVENKANYHHSLRNRTEETAVIFHGGFFSPQRGAFFKKLCEAAGPDRRLLHWGDIDLGGFQMHARLRREIDPRFAQYRMDKSELESHTAQTLPFSEDYARKLELLLQDPVLSDAQETLIYMLSHRRRLEQEALL